MPWAGAIWAAISSRAGQVVAAVTAVLAGLLWFRREVRQAERDRLRADAAAEEQEARRRGDAAAADAARDDVVDRLRRSGF